MDYLLLILFIALGVGLYRLKSDLNETEDNLRKEIRSLNRSLDANFCEVREHSNSHQRDFAALNQTIDLMAKRLTRIEEVPELKARNVSEKAINEILGKPQW